MRNPERIKVIISQFGRLWKKYPDMRFFQLVDFLRNPNEDVFYLEDDKVIERIREKLGEDQPR